MSAKVSSEGMQEERARLLKRLAEIEKRDRALELEEERLVRELAEVRQQISYYEMLNKDMKREAVGDERSRPFVDRARKGSFFDTTKR